MSEAGDGHTQAQTEVGSIGEEAAKLLGALSEWARESSGGALLGDGLSGIAGLAGQAAEAISEANEHVATDSPECTYCPVCRTVHVVRTMSPEVKAHLAAAGSSLLQALAGALAGRPGAGPSDEPGASFERIDLDGDPGDLG